MTTVDDYVGDDMSGKKGKGLHELSANEFMDLASGIHTKGSKHYIEDLAKRAEKVEEVHRGYHTHRSRLEQELSEAFDKVNLTKLKPHHDKIREAYIKNGGENISDPEARVHLKNLVEVILPQINYGTEGNCMNQFESYMNDLQHIVGQQKAKQMQAELMGAIKSGQGALASQKILEIMGLYHTSKYQSRLLSSLLNLEDGEFKSAYAGKIASAIEKHTGVKLCKPELEHSLDFALAERYIKGKPEYLGIAENYKAKEAPKEKGRHH